MFSQKPRFCHCPYTCSRVASISPCEKEGGAQARRTTTCPRMHRCIKGYHRAVPRSFVIALQTSKVDSTIKIYSTLHLVSVIQNTSAWFRADQSSFSWVLWQFNYLLNKKMCCFTGDSCCLLLFLCLWLTKFYLLASAWARIGYVWVLFAASTVFWMNN